MTDKKNCTGATELSGEALSKFRVYREGCLDYFAMVMSAEQISERRIYMRKILLQFPKWANQSNNELDAIRLYRAKDKFIVEDSEGHEIVLGVSKVTSEVSEFRKVRAMIPFEFMNLTGKDFKWDKYKADTSGEKNLINAYITKYLEMESNGIGLYIYSGTKGSGKTMLSCCLLNEIANRYGKNVKFVNILDFIEMTKKSYDGQTEDIDSIYQAKFLVLDDIGVQMPQEWINSILYRLINDRYVKRRPVIYTSNIPIEYLKIDNRITDRIESLTYPVKLPEESIRRDTQRQAKQELLNRIMGNQRSV